MYIYTRAPEGMPCVCVYCGSSRKTYMILIAVIPCAVHTVGEQSLGLLMLCKICIRVPDTIHVTHQT